MPLLEDAGAVGKLMEEALGTRKNLDKLVGKMKKDGASATSPSCII